MCERCIRFRMLRSTRLRRFRYNLNRGSGSSSSASVSAPVAVKSEPGEALSDDELARIMQDGAPLVGGELATESYKGNLYFRVFLLRIARIFSGST